MLKVCFNTFTFQPTDATVANKSQETQLVLRLCHNCRFCRRDRFAYLCFSWNILCEYFSLTVVLFPTSANERTWFLPPCMVWNCPTFICDHGHSLHYLYIAMDISVRVLSNSDIHGSSRRQKPIKPIHMLSLKNLRFVLEKGCRLIFKNGKTQKKKKKKEYLTKNMWWNWSNIFILRRGNIHCAAGDFLYQNVWDAFGCKLFFSQLGFL